MNSVRPSSSSDKELNRLKQKLNLLVKNESDMTSEKVLRLSEELDSLILDYYRNKKSG